MSTSQSLLLITFAASGCGVTVADDRDSTSASTLAASESSAGPHDDDDGPEGDDDDSAASTGHDTATTETSASAAESSSDGADDGSDDETTAGVDPDSILFAADFDDALFPQYGFSYETRSEGYSMRTAVVGAGPHGEDVCEYEMLANDEPSQPYIGWSRQGLPETAMGETRYIRLLVRVDSPCDAIGLTDVWDDKFIMVGDGTPDPWGPIGRVIVMLGDPHDGMVRTFIARNIDGAEHGTEAVELTCGDWHWLQWELRSSTSSDASDGGFRFWVDGDNTSIDAPTRTSPAFPLVSAIDEQPGNVWNNISLGNYVGTSLASGTMRFEFAAFEYGTAFDPSWHE